MQIYRIFNKINNKSYIGATKWEFNQRYPQGKWWKWTHNNHLKLAVKKYGLDNFSVEILNSSINSVEDLANLETLYIEQYDSFVPKGYNPTKGGYLDGRATREYELIDRNGTIYRIKNLSSFCRERKLSYGAILNMVCGLSHTSQGLALSSTPVEKIVDLTEEIQIKNIKTEEIFSIPRFEINKWAKSKNLNPRLIRKLIRGEILTSGNWILAGTSLPKNYKGYGPKHLSVKLINEDGEIKTVDNIFKFCKENNLIRTSFYDLVNGKIFKTQGWRLAESLEEFNKKKAQRRGKKIGLISPDGCIIEVKNISYFCRQNGFNRNGFEGLINGRSKDYCGWKLA